MSRDDGADGDRAGIADDGARGHDDPHGAADDAEDSAVEPGAADGEEQWRFGVDDVGEGAEPVVTEPDPIEPESVNPEHALFVALGVVAVVLFFAAGL